MKTVYVLGAGFSVEAGAPTQKNLVSETFRLNNQSDTIFDKDKFGIFKDFIIEQLNISEDDLASVELEDIFTPLDRCISENAQYRGVEVKKLSDVRESIFYVVGRTIQILLRDSIGKQEYIDVFSSKIIERSKKRERGEFHSYDPVSVISTNWDILLDNSVYRYIQDHNYTAVVDYCCYISSLEEEDPTVKPGLEILGGGGFNVKILKIHGSLNWLQCPRCMRLYVGFSKEAAMYNFEKQYSCRHCDKNFPEEKSNHALYSNLIMPTFIKDFTNPQYKIIWQNAGIEISEAEKLVFIGYSLPSADFEMRQLLSRMTRKNVQIEVVDFCKNENEIKTKKEHWVKFFGKRPISFYFDGAENYVSNIK
ncbi:hypothetical protein [Pectobacterium brasiliense]|uniref:hypothetical protein n=1 Tax=Pectobacterium brasiliense TaxID=180957 RepID=UPI0005834A9D|nr:hypothetical protein [Pectobacterium brasiliense]KHT24561.1 hypothetical protein RC95_03285 [Pectobacterium brasiliense]